MEKICIYIDGYIFATVKPNRFLLYNFEERTGRTFPVYNELTYKTLLSLTNPSNSYSIIIDKNLLKLKDLQDIAHSMGICTGKIWDCSLKRKKMKNVRIMV